MKFVFVPATILLAVLVNPVPVFACECESVKAVSAYQCGRDVLSCMWQDKRENPDVCKHIESNMLYSDDEDFRKCNG